jgi:hypothetical protein
MQIFTRRVAWAYTIILVGAILYMLRRLLLPTFVEVEGVPFEIGVGSVVSSCFGSPALNTCADPTVVILTIVGAILATGWGSPGRMAFAVILGLLPLGIFLALLTVWVPLIMLLLIPLAVEWGSQLLFPQSAP